MNNSSSVINQFATRWWNLALESAETTIGMLREMSSNAAGTSSDLVRWKLGPGGGSAGWARLPDIVSDPTKVVWKGLIDASTGTDLSSYTQARPTAAQQVEATIGGVPAGKVIAGQRYYGSIEYDGNFLIDVMVIVEV